RKGWMRKSPYLYLVPCYYFISALALCGGGLERNKIDRTRVKVIASLIRHPLLCYRRRGFVLAKRRHANTISTSHARASSVLSPSAAFKELLRRRSDPA